MAITREQTTGKFRISASTPAQGTFGTNPTEGELIVVGFWGYSGPNFQPQDCTDNQGNRYSLAAVSAAATRTLAVWWTIAGPSSGPFQVSITSAVAGAFSGAGCATSFSTDGTGLWRPDERVSATGNSTTPATGNTGTLDEAGELVIAMVGSITVDQPSIAVESVSPSWTVEAEELSWLTYLPGEMNSRIVSSTTAQSCSWTLGTSASWGCLVCTFKDA